MDTVLGLVETHCKELLFLGSVGAIFPNINVGDLIIPNEVICADGACRYLNKTLSEDSMGKKYFPDSSVYTRIYNAAVNAVENYQNSDVRCLTGKTVSVESYFAEGCFMDYGACCLDMESAAVLRAAQYNGIKAGCAYCVSDNAMKLQSLVTIHEELTLFRKNVRLNLMPAIIAAFLQREESPT